jgi:O-acetyl-ADP-ribose deacetylase (regulator of RNase III)
MEESGRMKLGILLGGRLIIETGDITEKIVDAIVNAANSTLLGGGGVDGAIHAKGGPNILVECKKLRETTYPDGLPTGKAVATCAGRLHARYIIHTVGPIWYGGKRGESGLLADSYLNSLLLARELGLSSIAFPAISTGVYGFPREEAADIVYATIGDYVGKYDTPVRIFLVFFSKDDALIFNNRIGE